MSDEYLIALADGYLPPYARAIGLEVRGIEDGAPIMAMPFASNVDGRPGFFHGGALGGLLETAGIGALHLELMRAGGGLRFKPVNVNVEFLRGAVDSMDTLALGKVTRTGRRIANVSVQAWQANRNKPVAEAWINFLLSPETK